MLASLRSFVVVTVITVAFGAALQPAGATELLLDQPSKTEGCFVADSECGQAGGFVELLADDLVLGQQTLIESVRVWGCYADNDPPAEDALTVIVYDDGPDNTPGDAISTQTGLPATRSKTGGISVDGEFEYVLDIDIADVELAAGAYWIGVWNESGPSRCFAIFTADGHDPLGGRAGVSVSFELPPVWNHVADGTTWAMQVYGSPQTPTPVVDASWGGVKSRFGE